MPPAAPPPAPHDAYVAFRHRDFRWYIFSTFTMTLGSQLQAVVVGWQVYTITHDPLSLGLIGLAEALPFIAVALPAGYVADRFNRRTVSVGALATLALCSVALLLLSAASGTLGRVGVWPIYAIIFASGIARSLLQRWKDQLGKKRPAEVFPGSGQRSPEQQEIAELKKKLSRVTEERDILKKALAYFADDQT